MEAAKNTRNAMVGKVPENNECAAEALNGVAELLELKGENAFKVRAYKKAAQVIGSLPEDIEIAMREGRLLDIPGIGETIARRIQELLATGKLGYYEELKAEFPEGVSRLLDIPGIGPRTASRLYKELGVKSAEELEQAIVAGQVAIMPRMGEKTAENLLRQVRAARTKDRRILLGQALPIVESIIAQLRPLPGLRNLTPAGSLRRMKETIGDIDIIGTADDRETVIAAFVQLPQVREIIAKGPQKASVLVKGGLQVDLRLMDHEVFGSLLQHFTGGKEHNVALRSMALKQGLSVSEYGITVQATGVVEQFAREEDVYARLGLQWMPPEMRENTGEIEAAARGGILRLVETQDIKGDLHLHTNWSDGIDTIEAMVQAARERGYQYCAISDHSVGRGIAHGLSVERLREQFQIIKELNERLEGFRVLTGIEVDLRADGSLDFPDELLGEIDIVTASVHSVIGQESDKMTERLMKAIHNPHVDVIGHPTGRIIQQRQPSEFDVEKVFKAAAATGTAMEVNSYPSRLDLKDSYIRAARDLGVLLVINTDSHNTDMLDFMRYGVAQARRGWCEARHVLNTKPINEILSYLQGRR